MNKNIESLYVFLLQQMAAESYFEDLDFSIEDDIKTALLLGANRDGYRTGNPALNDGYPGLTRMTEQQVTEFLAGFKLIHQWSDNPTPTGSRPVAEGSPVHPQLNSDILANTGLSATLIQVLDANGQPTNEYTLAIRSTEFRDWVDGGDGERDKTGADINSLAYTGFALAQLDALEQYYQWLRSNSDSLGNPLLPADAKLNITGYSLGGHLATVFTEIHRDETNGGQTVTFNGAGRGDWDEAQGNLADVIAYYHAVLNEPTTAPDPGNQYSLLRLAAVQASGTAFSDVSVYNDPRYVWAVQATQSKFNLSWMPLSDENRTGTSADDLITQVFGFETSHNVNVTANSGIHGPALRVGIESQPLLEGAGGVAGTEGDFGNAHSITLLADSLALQRAMNRLDAAFGLDDFVQILPATSRQSTDNGLNAGHEADPLENMLDGLRRMLIGTDVSSTPHNDAASGFGDIVTREAFHANLVALEAVIEEAGLEGRFTFAPSGASTGADARLDFGAFLALQCLSPFVLECKDPAAQAALNTTWQQVHGELYLAWAADRNATLYGDTPHHYSFSDQWLADRATLLQALSTRNRQNNDTGHVFDALAPAGQATVLHFTDPISGEAEVLVTRPSGGSALPDQHILFGGDDADTLTGFNNAKGDHLYGGAGADALAGLGGADHLEGGAGNDHLDGGSGSDTLLGGAGDDTLVAGSGDARDIDQLHGGSGADRYLFAADFNAALITDTDGQGRIEVNGVVLSGGQRKAEDLWLSEDGAWRYLRLSNGDLRVTRSADASTRALTLRGYFQTPDHGGRLGLNLLDANEEAPQGRLFTGDYRVATAIATADLTRNFENYLPNGSVVVVPKGTQRFVTGEFSNLQPGGDVLVTDNAIWGSPGADVMRGLTGNDLLSGQNGNDLIEGGIGDDLLNGSDGLDRLFGQDDNDRLYADLEQSDAQVIAAHAPDTEDTQGVAEQGEFLVGSNGDDWQVGHQRADLLLGGLGRDQLWGGAQVIDAEHIAALALA